MRRNEREKHYPMKAKQTNVDIRDRLIERGLFRMLVNDGLSPNSTVSVTAGNVMKSNAAEKE
jgi:hypothetical protein